MAENSKTEIDKIQAVYDYERHRIPTRELSPTTDRSFHWEGWNPHHPLPNSWLEHYASAFHFSDSELLEARTTAEWPQASGIYFLFDGDELVYVGQTQNFQIRSRQHQENGMHWTSHAYFEAPRFHLKEIEAYYIQRIGPRFNSSYPRLNTYSNIVKKLGLDRDVEHTTVFL